MERWGVQDGQSMASQAQLSIWIRFLNSEILLEGLKLGSDMIKLSCVRITAGCCGENRLKTREEAGRSVRNSDIHFSSVTQLCPTPCDPMACSTPGFPMHHHLPELTQTHIHCVGDAILPSHPLSSPSPPALNLSQDQGLFKWVSSSHKMTKVLEFQL